MYFSCPLCHHAVLHCQGHRWGSPLRGGGRTAGTPHAPQASSVGSLSALAACAVTAVRGAGGWDRDQGPPPPDSPACRAPFQSSVTALAEPGEERGSAPCPRPLWFAFRTPGVQSVSCGPWQQLTQAVVTLVAARWGLLLSLLVCWLWCQCLVFLLSCFCSSTLRV